MSYPDLTDNTKYEGVDILDIIKVLKRNYITIICITVLAIIIIGLLSFFFFPPVYEAKAVLMITRVADTAEKQQTTMNTFVGQIKSDILLQRIIDQLHMNDPNRYPSQSGKITALVDGLFNHDNQKGQVISTNDLSRQIKVVPIKDSNLIEIYVSNSNPHLATTIANTLGREFIKFATENNKQMVNSSIQFLEEQMVSLQKELDSTTDPSRVKIVEDALALLTDRTRIARSIDIGNTSIVVVSPAVEPLRPVKPNPGLNMLLALILGLMIAVFWVLVKDCLDNTVKFVEDIEKYTGFPVLGIIPYPGRRVR